MSRTPFSHILLVEDEPHLGVALEVALRPMAERLTRAMDLAEAARVIRDSTPDLVVLDRGLPDGDGLDLCKSIRNDGFEGAVLILTAAGDVYDRVAGLKSGADDYLAKPFAWEELEARIQALSRRARIHSATSSEWELDSARLRIHGPKGWEELTPLEFRLAERLIRADGAIVSRDDLLREVWGFTLLPRTRTVDYFLGRLRKRFEQDTDAPRYFLTVRGAGYRFSRT